MYLICLTYIITKYIINPIITCCIIYGNDFIIDQLITLLNLTQTIKYENYDCEDMESTILVNKCDSRIPLNDDELFINNVIIYNAISSSMIILNRFLLILYINNYDFNIRDLSMYFDRKFDHIHISYINSDGVNFMKLIDNNSGINLITKKKILFGNIFS